MDTHLLGYVGAVCLIAGGVGWGAQVAGHGVTGRMLVLTVALSAVGLTLAARAFLAGHDLPLILGAVGALAGATLMVFTRRDE
ncbi:MULTISPECIES: hypothetical protein [Deinococcus]|uniref:Uncharacterized protein n=1 Tax=Deinococcus rufus TaxID=2136097 RepID=A0ABV7Z6W1_9DEIO|nr:hypothetical protein [Deinococcus sp. AB2017081]WQE96449.1 hypothetical protein U2P90_05990 [Deinococcus sp. AB2017081]